MALKEVKVGILGFGTVGAGVAQNILMNGDVIAKRANVAVKLVSIADLDITTDRGVKVPQEILTTDAHEAIQKSDIVVELIGGTKVAKTFILEALNAGKSVVTANKALLALHGPELFEAAEKSGADLYYEASVGGGIPIIKSLREGLISNRIQRIYGILNGTCNYILTRMEREGGDFAAVLADAQKLGYAEANPSLDIDGFDTAHKTAILAALAFGRWFGLDPIKVEGIRDLESADIEAASELGYRIKLLAVIKSDAGKVQMSVRPTLIPKEALLASISDVFNGVMVEGDMVGQTLFYGRGAGRSATASAVTGDVVDVAINLANGTSRRIVPFRSGEQFTEVLAPEEVSSRYYLRFEVKDCAGVFASIAQTLAKYGISMSSLIQRETAKQDGFVPIVLLTHETPDKKIRAAVQELEAMKVNASKIKLLHVEDL